MVQTIKKYLPDSFITGILLMIIAAWIKPGIGMNTQPVNLGLVINIGVAFIFFFHGLKLDFLKIKDGMKNWRLHMMIQLTTFFVFILIVLPFYPLLAGTELYIFWLGVYFLAALPSTVSSSVILVSIAGGNIPAAIFNAGISGFIGIVMTPLWIGLFLIDRSMGVDVTGIFLKLVTQIILPVVAGLLLNKVLRRWTNKYHGVMSVLEKVVLLFVVYKSFSHSFMEKVFSSVSTITLAGLFISVVLLFFIVYNFTGFIGRRLHFSHEDRITLRFAGTQKSLVHGSVYASIFFIDSANMGVLLLPVIIYHGFQLVYLSVVAGRMRGR